MVQFHIQPDSEIPASTQLLNQICFAIASRQFPPGYRLPSTRQLAMQTGLHRNTISKIYERLEVAGFVEAQAGSGIYVRSLGQESLSPPEQQSSSSIRDLMEQSVETFLHHGYSLVQVRELLLKVITERLQASAQVIVTVPQHDWGAGEIMVQELQQALSIPVELVFLEALEATLKAGQAATVVTVRYFAKQAEEVLKAFHREGDRANASRIIPIDIYNYDQELQLIQTLPQSSCLGLVSLSSGTLEVAEVMVNSLRGDDLYVLSAQCQDQQKLNAVIHYAHTIISDRASCDRLKSTVQAHAEELIRLPQIVCCPNYIDRQSIQLLKLELGLEDNGSSDALPAV